ncbi:hypothetical protein C8F01DRAFT_1372668 [Mycena amicta]|nr:hypothetical protein C8F01DRAFT_1372668 [Mycena amicta]
MAEPYVREATIADLDEISVFEARAFAHDPEMNWFGGLSTAESPSKSANLKNLENLRVFLDFINRSVLIAGGRVTVVAVPQESGKEKLLAMAAWVPPHKIIEGTMTSIRAKGHRIVFNWGLSFIRRASVIFKPTVGAIVKKSLKTKGFHETDHYRLEITATHPEFQGKGLSSLLMKEGFAKCDASKPITLEATTEHSRDVYSHQGFEMVQALTLGRGQVDKHGLKTNDKESAVGFEVSVMIRWPPKTR